MRMEPNKRKRLEDAGWQIGSTADFLGLSYEETVYVELRIRLSDALRHIRKVRRLSQHALAGAMGSSQSRVAKMEGNDPSVSLDLLIRSLIHLGVSRSGLARIMGFEETQPITVQASAGLQTSVVPGTFKLSSVAENASINPRRTKGSTKRSPSKKK